MTDVRSVGRTGNVVLVIQDGEDRDVKNVISSRTGWGGSLQTASNERKGEGPPGDGVEKGSTICKNRLRRTASWPGVRSVLLYVIPVR